MSARPLVNQDAARSARSVLFWMGVVYLTIIVHIMTPFTNNLDDIRVTTIHILGPILIAAYLIFLALRWVEMPRAAVSVPLALYLVVMVLSTILAQPFLRWLAIDQTLQQWVVLGPFLVFFASGIETRRLRHGLVFFSLLALSSALFGLCHRLGVPQLVQIYIVPSLARGSVLWRFVKGLADTFANCQDMLSIILNRDFYAAFLALTLPIVVGSLLLYRIVLWQVIASITFLLGAICLNMTNSKDSYLAVAISFALIAFLYIYVARLPVRYRRRLLTILIALACLMATMILLNLRSFLGQIKTFDVSFTSRAIIWGGAIDIWKTSPILGAGPGSFRVLFPYFRRPDYFLFDISHRTLSSHNYFLDLLDETGVAGFVVFMTFLALVFWHCLARVRRDPEPQRRIIGLCLVAGMTGFCLNAITSPNPRWPIGAVNLWAALGMMAGFIQRPLPAPQSQGATAAGRLFPTVLSPRLAWIVWFVLLPLTVVLGVRTAFSGVQYYRAAYYNNLGLAFLGDASDPKIIYELKGKLSDLRGQLKRSGLSAEEKATLQKRIDATEKEFETYRRLAENYMRKAAEIQPTFSTSLYKLGTLVFMGPYDRGGKEAAQRALEVFRQLDAFWPEYSQLSYNFFRVYDSLGETDKALEAGRRAAKQTIDNDTHLLFCRFLLLNDRAQEALEDAKWAVAEWDKVLKKPLGKTPEEKKEILIGALDTLSQVANVARDYETQLEALERLRALVPDDRRVVRQMAALYVLQGDFAGLESAMHEILEEMPADPTANYWLGYAALRQGKTRLAKRQALILERISPRDPNGAFLFFDVYRQAGRTDQAARYADAILTGGYKGDRIEEIQEFLRTQNAASAPDKASAPR